MNFNNKIKKLCSNTRMRKSRTRESSAYDERMDIIDKKWCKARKRLPYCKTSASHWPIPYKYPNYCVRNSPLYKVYHGIPIRITEYRYLVNYFKYKGLTFSYPIEKIKFTDEENRSNTSEVSTNP